MSALLVAFLLTLGGCGGGDSDGSSSVTLPPSGGTPTPPPTTPAPPPGETLVENVVSGSVGDGPIVGARVRVFARNGAQLLQTSSTDSADYNLTIKTQGNNYALRVEADRGIDLVTGLEPDFRLVSAIAKPNTRTVSNINPFTTLIFGTAERSGGINDSTVAAARHAVMSRYAFGLDPSIIPDPTSTEITASNVHVIVKTSETLGEMVRRTRDALISTGMNISGDDVVTALNADLVDGWIDGSGAYGSSSRIAAVANVAGAAVMIEAMSNQLQVYGVNATQAMDQSIRHVRPTAPASANTSNVRIPASAFEQTARMLRAAQAVSSDPSITAAIAVMESAAPNALPSEIAAQLPAGIRGVLRNATTTTAQASDAVISAVNDRGRGGDAPPAPEPPPPAPPPGPDPEPPPAPPPGPDPEPEPPAPPVNTPPTISGNPSPTAEVGVQWSFTPSASDADGDSLTFTVQNRPSWATFTSSTGRLAGTPNSAHIGTYNNIIIRVSDGNATTSLPAFSITVNAPPVAPPPPAPEPPPPPPPPPPPANNPPVISGNPGTTAQVGVQYSFTPSASDADGDSLTFSIANRPSWATFRTSDGRLRGTPTSANVGTFNNIVITVSDGKTTTSLPAFSITVGAPPPPPNQPPVISGSPSTTTLVVGSPWSFTPTASDPDGDTLTFSVTGLPSWATFRSSDGRISGTPASNHVGVWENIRISVTDGTHTVSLSAFSLTVTAPQPSTGSATVSWTPPTQRVDGSPIGTISGYKVYYSRNASQLDQVDSVGNNVTSRLIENLESGTWYFAVSTLADGMESQKSGTVSKTIP